jgi:hypothetical protein
LPKFLGQPNRPTSVSNWPIPEKRSARNVAQLELSGKSHISSGRVPLLAPSPLRTGLESFPSSGSSTQKRPPKKRGRGLIQKKPGLLDIDLLPIRTAEEIPSAVWEAAPTGSPVVICFASFIGSSSGLEFEHQREVSSVSSEVMWSQKATQPLSAQLQGSLRFFPFLLPAWPSVHLAMHLPLAGSNTGLPCSGEMTR